MFNYGITYVMLRRKAGVARTRPGLALCKEHFACEPVDSPEISLAAYAAH